MSRRTDSDTRPLHDLLDDWKLPAAIFLVVLVSLAIALLQYQTLRIAWGGWSVLHWLRVTLDPIAGPLDFPSGVQNYSRSSWMLLQRMLATLGVPDSWLPPTFVIVDTLAWSAACLLLMRLTSGSIRAWPALLLLLIATCSPAGRVNLANFGRPAYHALYYCVADLLTAGTWLLLWRRQWMHAALTAGALYTIHPISAAFCLAGGAFMILFRDSQRVLRDIRLWKALAVLAAISVIWSVYAFGSANMRSGSIPAEIWVGLTRLESVHWYPVNYGWFSELHQFRFFPFVALVMLAVPELWALAPERRRAILGLWAAGALMTTIGLAVSAIDRPPAFLIKLSLPRSSDLVALTALPLAAVGLWKAVSQNWWSTGLTWLMTLLVFVPKHNAGWPLVWVTLYFWLRVFDSRQHEQYSKPVLTVVALTGTALLAAYTAIYGFDARWASPGYTGYEKLQRLSGALAPLLLAGLLTLPLAIRRPDWRRIVLIALAILGALQWPHRAFKPGDLDRKEGYLEVQLWANEHSPRDSIWMPPPTLFYGWRDFSGRASFGNMREWLHTSWLYDSDPAIYAEAMKRFSVFGLPLDPYIRADNTAMRAHYAIVRDVARRYANASDSWRYEIAKRFGVDYFIVDANTAVAATSAMPVVFRNKYYLVLSADRTRQES